MKIRNNILLLTAASILTLFVGYTAWTCWLSPEARLLRPLKEGVLFTTKYNSTFAIGPSSVKLGADEAVGAGVNLLKAYRENLSNEQFRTNLAYFLIMTRNSQYFQLQRSGTVVASDREASLWVYLVNCNDKCDDDIPRRRLKKLIAGSATPPARLQVAKEARAEGKTAAANDICRKLMLKRDHYSLAAAMQLCEDASCRKEAFEYLQTTLAGSSEMQAGSVDILVALLQDDKLSKEYAQYRHSPSPEKLQHMIVELQAVLQQREQERH